MILLIDAGNTRIKSAVRAGTTITSLQPVATDAAEPPAAWHEIDTPQRVFVSSVAGSDVEAKLRTWVAKLWSLEPVFAVVRERAAGMTTRYDSPGQLGVDRWLAALAGYHLAAGAACVVDAGTALTIDIVDPEGTHLGGSITPGLRLMADSLTRNTAHLRLEEFNMAGTIATNTISAISNGCIDAFAGGIERMVARVERELGAQPPWFVTGGEAQTVIDVCQLEFRHVPDLVLQGLAIAEGDKS